ncbi:MAG: hypothetical protein RSD81_23885, partial [Pseudomonas sp.]
MTVAARKTFSQYGQFHLIAFAIPYTACALATSQTLSKPIFLADQGPARRPEDGRYRATLIKSRAFADR